jgi:hypothetical protein
VKNLNAETLCWFDRLISRVFVGHISRKYSFWERVGFSIWGLFALAAVGILLIAALMVCFFFGLLGWHIGEAVSGEEIPLFLTWTLKIFLSLAGFCFCARVIWDHATGVLP